MAIELLRSFLQQATASGSRSTVLTDLRWFAGISFSALLIALKFSAPVWILVFIAVILGLICLIYLGAYVFFAVRTPDALRSERFTLSKMAIERSVTGDNLAGFIDPMTDDSRPLTLPASPPKEEHS